MENLPKITLFLFLWLLSSCLLYEEREAEVVGEINENYFVLTCISCGEFQEFQIGYSLDEESYQIIANFCYEIYYNKDTIMYSRILFKGDEPSYFIIPVNPKRKDGLVNDAIAIKKSQYINNSLRFEKFNLSDKN